jgi:hypothetical protein
METKSIRPRLAKLEEEIVAFEHWQKASTREDVAKKGPRRGRQGGDAQGIRGAHMGRTARYANRPCGYRRRTAALRLESLSNLQAQVLRVVASYLPSFSIVNRPQPEPFTYEEHQHETPSA